LFIGRQQFAHKNVTDMTRRPGDNNHAATYPRSNCREIRNDLSMKRRILFKNANFTFFGLDKHSGAPRGWPPWSSNK
jgi:hypothetical protein